MEWNAELNSCQRINLIQAIFITLYKIDILIPVRAMAYASWRFYFYFLVSFFLDWLGKLTLGNNTTNTLVISRLSWISRVYGILNFAYCVKFNHRILFIPNKSVWKKISNFWNCYRYIFISYSDIWKFDHYDRLT